MPIELVAYQAGHSTTEQVYTVKTLAEKAIISSDYIIFILMLDTPKVFNSINRTKLKDYIGEILNERELYMMNILINDVVQCGNETGKDIIMNVGICQGDYLPAVLLIVYLA